MKKSAEYFPFFYLKYLFQKGAQAIVYKVTENSTGKIYAAKQYTTNDHEALFQVLFKIRQKQNFFF